MKNYDFIPAKNYFSVKVLCFLFSIIVSTFLQSVTAQVSVSGSAAQDGVYTSLTNASGAFVTLNAASQAGRTIVITITSDVTTEAGTNALTGAAGMWTSLTIKPSGARIISGSVAKPIIDLSGADYVTIDGLNASGNTLTISNASTSTISGTSTIRFINDATYNTIKNCTVKGSSGSSSSPNYAATILFNSATVGNNNNVIEYNNITNAGGVRPAYGSLFSTGTNSLNIIRYNNFYDIMAPGVGSNGISLAGANFSWTINGNSFYETTASPGFVTTSNNTTFTAINTLGGYGYTVTGNYIGGNGPNCSGTWYKAGDFDNSFVGIYIKAITGAVNSIQGNIIKGFNWSNTNASNTSSTYFTAIFTQGGASYGDFNIGDVTPNIIGAATGNGSIIFTANYMGGTVGTTSAFYGIKITYGGVILIKNNVVGAITTANATAANGVHIYGITRDFNGTATTNIENNTIGSTDAGTTNSLYASAAATGATSSQQVWGIRSDATGTITITGNTISKLTNGSTSSVTSSTYASYNIGIVTTSGTNSITNNTVHDLTNGSSTVSGDYQSSVVGIAQPGTTAAAQSVNGNEIYNLSNTNASFTGNVIGLWYSGSTTASNVSKNFIKGLSASSSAAGVYGIKINSGTATYANNIISLGGTAVTPLYGTFYGIYETGSASNNNSLFFNTISIGGTPVSGTARNSYALYSAVNTNTRDFRNNIFSNARSNGGTATGSHYAMYIVASGGTLTSNYNDYYASGTGGVLGYFAANKTVLPIVTAQDANSLSSNPLFASAGGTLASDYFVSAALPAITGTGITTDYNGNARSLTPRMGVWEVNGTLAVSLTSFTGVAAGSANYLQWITANETDNNYFELQRSENGISFNTLATIDGAGNTVGRHLYSYQDVQPLTGKNFYRLKQVDINGRISYSAVINITTDKGSQQFSVYPNPVTHAVLNIQLSSATVVKIFNSAGAQVLTQSLPAGIQQLNVGNFAKGVYYIQAGTKTEIVVIR